MEGVEVGVRVERKTTLFEIKCNVSTFFIWLKSVK